MASHLNIVYKDEWIIVLEKPAGLLCHPVGHYQGDTLDARLRSYFGSEARLVHRLDQNTSGLMVIARSLRVARIFYKQFSRSKVYKEYVALVHGILPMKHGRIEFPLRPCTCQENVIKIKMEIHPQGMAARTEFDVLEEYGEYSLVRLIPSTGKKHQIRKHLAFIGHPIVGEPLYALGGLPFLWNYYLLRPSPWDIKILGHCLHACKIEFIHPISEDILSFSVPIPSTWEKIS
ncbi:MAG: RluA family pseudouridine synthase [Planctomycetes bacterium]|nr:RluA family pseudouridine synthase [Planctomycetota bacterium]HON45397.1 RluA family pseudouridine synthase [Planctomycetota bacterium]HPY74419.1 RluA family pseudouridine synthase [Planctomycetota bacterium]HQA99921.1 RluA family pseudouridine synthase [Planctomycetota bacterium]HRU52655.1 RluA family pseudouridine synthase [Planctomycetota bacterium]